MLTSSILCARRTEQRRETKEGAASLQSLSRSAKNFIIFFHGEYRVDQRVHRACQASLTTLRPELSRRIRPNYHKRKGGERKLCIAVDPNIDRETLIYEKRAYYQISPKDGGIETKEGEIPVQFRL